MEKINWAEIKNQIENSCFQSIIFQVDGHRISVTLVAGKGLSKNIAVYIDGYIKGKWDENNMPIIAKVWSRKIVRHHSIANRKVMLEKFTKYLGKRAGKRMYEELGIDDESFYYSPIFTSSSKFISTFKKIEGITLLKEEKA